MTTRIITAISVVEVSEGTTRGAGATEPEVVTKPLPAPTVCVAVVTVRGPAANREL